MLNRGRPGEKIVSAREAETFKIVVFRGGNLADKYAVRQLRAGLLTALGKNLRKRVTLARVRGGYPHKHFELVFDSEGVRDRALTKLCEAHAPRTLRCSLRAGRPYEVRRTGRVAAAGVAPPQATKPQRAHIEDDHAVQVGFLNIRGLRTKEVEVATLIKECGLHILGLSETNLHPADRGLLNKEFSWFGRNKDVNKHESHGVGLCVSSALARGATRLTDPAFHDSLWVKIAAGAKFVDSHGTALRLAKTLFVGVVYLSPNLSAAEMKSALTEMTSLVKHHKAQGGSVVVLGDLNCRFS